MKNLKFECSTKIILPGYGPPNTKCIKFFYEDNEGFLPVYTDSKGREYVEPPNYVSASTNFSFKYRLKDAIEIIRNGDAHVLMMHSHEIDSGKNIYKYPFPIYYLDEEYGETIRKRYIEGWKNAEFETVLLNPYLYEGCYYYNNGRFLSIFSSESLYEEDIVGFSNDIEASKARYDILTKIQDLCDKINNDPNTINSLSYEEEDLFEMTQYIDCKYYPNADNIVICQRLTNKKWA